MTVSADGIVIGSSKIPELSRCSLSYPQLIRMRVASVPELSLGSDLAWPDLGRSRADARAVVSPPLLSVPDRA